MNGETWGVVEEERKSAENSGNTVNFSMELS